MLPASPAGFTAAAAALADFGDIGEECEGKVYSRGLLEL